MTPLPGLIAAALQVPGLLGAADGSFWMPPQRSTVAPDVDFVFNFILWICTFFFALITVLMLWFLVRYRRRPGVEQGTTPDHNTSLEVFWSVIPTGLVVAIFYLSFTTYMDMKTAPRNSYDVNVIAQKWNWTFEYPNGVQTDKLHVPVDRPVRLTMRSRDVIHSLYIPDFRVKMDVVPGRYTQEWFQAVEPGEFDLYCAEYCGAGHSEMFSKVVVHRSGEFEKWLEDEARRANNAPPAERGEHLFRVKGCASCHSTDGTIKIGPSLRGVYGRPVTLSKGAPVDKADEDYLRESILDPSARIVAGFESKAMSPYKGLLNDGQVSDLIEYIKSLK